MGIEVKRRQSINPHISALRFMISHFLTSLTELYNIKIAAIVRFILDSGEYFSRGTSLVNTY